MFGFFNRFLSSRQKGFYIGTLPNGESEFQVAISLAEYMEYYRTCTPVGTSIDMISDRASQIKPYAIKDGSYLNKNNFLELLQKPNKFQTYAEFVSEGLRHYMASGNNFIIAKSDRNSNLVSLENINPRRISFDHIEYASKQLYPARIKIANLNGIDDVYEYKLKNREAGYYLDNNELIIYKTSPDDNGIIPYSYFLGKSPLTSVEKEILLYNEANIHNKSGMARALTADKLVTVDKDSGFSLNNDEQRKNLEETLRTQFTGAHNSGKVIISLLGLKILDIKNPFVAKDMDFSSQKMNSELQIYKKLDIPLPLVNSITSNSQNIIEGATVKFYEETIIPAFTNYFTFLKNFVYDKYYTRSIDAFGYKVLDILPLRKKIIDNILQLDKAKVVYKNELREMLNIPKEEGLDVFFMDGNQVPIGTDADNESLIGNPLIDYNNNRGTTKTIKVAETFNPTEEMGD